MKKEIECPAVDETCPYFKNGKCTLENPKEECEDYYYLGGK